MPTRDEFIKPDECLALVQRMGWLDTAVQTTAPKGLQRVQTFLRSDEGKLLHLKRIAQILLYSRKKVFKHPLYGEKMYNIEGFKQMAGRLPTPEDVGYKIQYFGDSLIRSTNIGFISEFKLIPPKHRR